jgi:hypothetical protein
MPKQPKPLAMPKQPKPNGTPGKKPAAGPAADEENSSRAIATTVLEVFLAGMRYNVHGPPAI